MWQKTRMEKTISTLPWMNAEVVTIECEHNIYTWNISTSITVESVSGTIQVQLQKLSPSLGDESLTSLLIWNIVTSVLRNHTIPLGVLINRKKIKHMFDYQVNCSYLCSGEIHKAEKRVHVTVSGLIQHIADNFNTNMSSPNGKVSTHSLAMIECFTESDNTIKPESSNLQSEETGPLW